MMNTVCESSRKLINVYSWTESLSLRAGQWISYTRSVTRFGVVLRIMTQPAVLEVQEHNTQSTPIGPQLLEAAGIVQVIGPVNLCVLVAGASGEQYMMDVAGQLPF